MQEDNLSEKLAEVIFEVGETWGYLNQLTNGKDDLLKFAKVENKKNGLKRLTFYSSSFLEYTGIPQTELLEPREFSLLEFYLDYLKSRVKERERKLLDFAIENNLSYLERILSQKGRKSELPSFLKRKRGKVFVSKEFMQWAEITWSELRDYSEIEGKTLEESLKEHYLIEIMKEIEKAEEES